MKYTRIVTGLAVLCMIALSSVSAAACGGAFMFAILFQKYPEARAVSAAVSQARQAGILQGDEWPSLGTGSLHAWRTDKVSDMVEALEHRLNATAVSSGDLKSLHVFLINEFLWIEIQVDGDQAVVRKAPSGPSKDAPKAFTTRRVMDSLLDRSITWRQAVEDGLIASRCVDGCLHEPLAFLGQSLSTQADLSPGLSAS